MIHEDKYKILIPSHNFLVKHEKGTKTIPPNTFEKKIEVKF